jgi:hypothetical protein
MPVRGGKTKKFLFFYIPEQDAIVPSKKHKNYERYKDLKDERITSG